jgi:hypothetical protein
MVDWQKDPEFIGANRAERARRAIRHWCVAFLHGVREGWFGWGAAAGGAIVAYIAAQKGFIKAIDPTSWWLTQWWSMTAIAVLGGLVAVTIPNALVAPYRVWRMLKPFRIKVVSSQLGDEYPKGKFPHQSAAVVVTNLSYRQRSNCGLYVLRIAGFDNQHHTLPRFISKFSLLPGETREIEFLTWTTRSPLLDPTFMLSGPIEWGWGGNVVTLPCGSYDIDIRIDVPEADAVVKHCRVWADGNELRAALRDGR